MRKIYMLLSLIIMLAAAGDAQSSLDQRHGWWKIRLKTLQQEKRALQRKNDLEPLILTIVEKDIARAKKMLAAFEGETEDVKPESDEKNAAHDTGWVEAEARKITTAVFALRYLEHLSSSAGDMRHYAQTRAAVERSLEALLQNEMDTDDGTFVKALADEHISIIQWRYLTMESFFYAMLTHKSRLLDVVISQVEKDTLSTAGVPGRACSRAELIDLVTEKALARCTALDLSGAVTIDAEALGRSVTWKDIAARLGKSLARFKEIRGMLDDGGRGLSPAQSRHYFRNPGEMDEAIFKSAASRYFDRRAIGRTSFDRSRPGGESYGMNIPKNPDGLMMFREMDDLRKKAAGGLNGREDRAFFTELKSGFDAILDRHLGETLGGFDKEEAAVRALKEKNPEIEILNEDTFLKAKANFVGRADLARGYADKSVGFIKLLSEARQTDGDSVMRSYEQKLRMNREFLELTLSLTVSAAAIAPMENLSLHRDYTLAVRRVGTILKTIAYGLSIDGGLTPFLSKSTLSIIREEKARFIEDMKRTRAEVSRLYGVYVRERDSRNTRTYTEEQTRHEKIAALEIEAVSASLKSQAAAFDRLNRGLRAFNDYAALFQELQEELNRGTVSAKLERALSMKSIIPLVGEFDARQIRAEAATRSYLKKAAATDMARLSTLVHYYKQKNIVVKNTPSDEFMETIRLKLTTRPVAAVASWTMTEHNFRDIDRNAVILLARLKNRIGWSTAEKSDTPGPGNAGLRIPVPGATAIVHIPEGWNRRPGSTVYNAGHAVLESPDRDAGISIWTGAIEGKNIQGICLERARSDGAQVVKQRWGKKGELDYFWALCRLPKNRVMEIYVVRRGSHSLTFAGTSERAKYRFFKQKLDMVFNSLNFVSADDAERRRLSRKD